MIFDCRENKTHNLRIELFDWNKGSACVEIPELFPLFLLHALARRPGQGDLLSMQPELVQVLQGPVLITCSMIIQGYSDGHKKGR